jgi:hypothetical protein
MTMAIRGLVGLIILAGGLAGAGLARPDLAVLDRQGETDTEQYALRRLHAKHEIILALMARDLGLFEAAAWFRELNSSPPEFPAQGWQRLPGRCDDEKICRQVIFWARAQMLDTMPTCQVQAQVQQMEGELEAHIARHGKVILP